MKEMFKDHQTVVVRSPARGEATWTHVDQNHEMTTSGFASIVDCRASSSICSRRNIELKNCCTHGAKQFPSGAVSTAMTADVVFFLNLRMLLRRDRERVRLVSKCLKSGPNPWNGDKELLKRLTCPKMCLKGFAACRHPRLDQRESHPDC